MLVSLEWLRTYVQDNLTTEELAAKLTASGLSVERIYTVGEGLDDLIVGEVVSVRQHPNADRLRLAQVNIGTETVEVVCGATNLAAGQHIVYAAEGARIPVDMHDDKRQPFVLKKATIRGVESQGMICSVAEMGIGEDHEGILILPDSTEIGDPITKALSFPQTVLDVEVTTNRSDELSMLGIAREVSALTGKPLIFPESKKINIAHKDGYEAIVETEYCFRLMTQMLEVTIKPSPWWMQQYLTLAGMRPVNNVVDITNFVMLEYGQPLHAYDTSKLTGQRIMVRLAKEGELLSTLDGVERKLSSEMMVIADDSGAIGLAGIMGGEASKITDATTTIALEAAAFDPINIRKTANTLALRTEASRRFERTVDREATDEALTRAVSLLVEYADARKIGQRRNSYPNPLEAHQITLTSNKLYQYLGKEIDPLEVRKILKSLGFGDTSAFGKDKDWQLAAWVPSWRASDIQEEVDLIEEVVRILGYEHIPVALPSGELPHTIINHRYAGKQRVKQYLAQAGWTEIITLSLTGEAELTPLGMHLPAIKVANPLSAEWTHMRSSLLPGLIHTASRNIRNNSNLQLFELSNVYLESDSNLPQEELRLSWIATSQKQNNEQLLPFIKGVLAGGLRQLGMQPALIGYRKSTKAPAPFSSHGAAAITLDGVEIGFIGALPPHITEALDLPTAVIVAEISVDQLLGQQKPQQFIPQPRFQSLEEDLSLITSEEASLGKVADMITSAGGDLLESAMLTDVYRHASIGAGKKSPSFHLVFRAKDRTLNSKDVAAIRNNILEELKKEGIDVRS